MNVEDDEFSPFGGFSSGCDLHGEDFLRECTMCGIEFCSACFPNSALCPDCAAQGEFDDEEEAQAPAEEKELLLLDGIIDVESEAVGEEPAPAAPPKAVPPPKRPAKASPKAKSASRKPAKPVSKPKKRAKSAPQKTKAKSKAKPAPKAKAKRKVKKPARPAPKKAKAKAKPRKKR